MSELKAKIWNVYRYHKETKKSDFLGVVRARGSPHALGAGWKKFKVPRTNQELSKIYVRIKD